jgi:hypothetical protein
MKGFWAIAIRILCLELSLSAGNICAGNHDPLAVDPALHGAPKYEVVLFNAEHSIFTDRPLPGDREPRNPNHRRVILSLSTAFGDAYPRGAGVADRPRPALGPGAGRPLANFCPLMRPHPSPANPRRFAG